MTTEYSGESLPRLLAIVDNVIAINEKRRCEMFWPINDGHASEQCKRSAVTFCGTCGKEICRECAEVVSLNTYCQPCAGIKQADIQYMLRSL